MRATELFQTHQSFIPRHLGPREQDIQSMLAELGVQSLDELTDQIVPEGIRLRSALSLAAPQNEQSCLAELSALAAENRLLKNYLGQGYYGTHTPPVILRNVLENPAWYTAYTPYQPEISQGRLEALLNFQTMVCELTGMDISNASMLDEATAAAEAMTLALRSARSKSTTIAVDADTYTQTLALLRTRAEPLGLTVKVAPLQELLSDGEAYFALFVQSTGRSGRINDIRGVAERIHAQQGLLIVAADLLALCLMTPPGQWGADIVVGSAQRFGVPMAYGGPHAGFLACRDAYKRSMPGRLVGLSVDAAGAPALRLAMQTREQHIRREKATSNICTAQVLLAVIASFYAIWHGPEGLQRMAQRVHALARLFARGVRELGLTVADDDSFFDTVVVDVSDARVVVARAQAAGINIAQLDQQRVLIAFDETHELADLPALWSVFDDAQGVHSGTVVDLATCQAWLATLAFDPVWPADLVRPTPCLQHPIFSAIQSETEMLRYLRRLADKDLALDRSMIPLGSCTMKLNATAEMIPITWPGFSGLHPMVPADQALGYRKLIQGLSEALVAVTGYDSVSLQPNSGAQGEYAGLLAIRAYHRARGESQRDVCLIPTSAHGTNPASAQMCGMDVVAVACDDLGNVDLDDLRRKVAQYRDTAQGNRIAALMVTYPSTHGVFEQAIREICEIIHEAGGQVYLDGANMNALVGVAQPGRFGADVSHLNLHKTFCIPHGGGGPGVGPVAVRAHLAPYLPSSPFEATEAQSADAVGAVSAAPFGSAGILPISYAYVKMMGAEGLKRATQVAMLNANYIASRLRDHYEVLYSGPGGRVAHECILDTRPFKTSCGVTVDDIAKRLIDYGFHAPTMSFPVAGTLMVEPTESESKAELDRFIEAMIAIRNEIRAIEQGLADPEDSPLKHAPHTATAIAQADWQHGYSREQAVYPSAAMRHAKYWPPVARVDNAYGDRHLICTCPPMSEYAGG